MFSRYFFGFFATLFALAESATISIEDGDVLGSIKTTETGTQYHNFQGIPYARPPIEGLKFRDPVAPLHWRGQPPLNCTFERPPFWGVNGITMNIEGEFDALRLNIYTNNLNPSSPYPVMVWIHGGGWLSGSSTTDVYGPDYLVERNVTIVTMNYRLGAFGFLSLDDEDLHVPGNQAFKDQRMALRWVQRNIASFGGDPNRVTLFGQSSGAGSVHYHMISEGSRGLFQRAILMAGSALHNGYYTIPRRNWAQRLAARLNFTSTSESAILTFLENANPKDVITQSLQLLTPEENKEGLAMPFGPTVEPFATDGIFLADEISKLAPNAWGNNISIIIGANSMEGLSMLPLLRNDPNIFDLRSNFELYIPRELNVTRGSEASIKYAEILKKTYYGLLDPSSTNIDGIMKVFADNVLWYPAHRAIRYRQQSDGGGSTFVYRFDADSQNNVLKELLILQYPSARLYREPGHSDDFTHLFKTLMHKPLTEMNQVSYDTLKQMITLFTSFADSGYPTGMAGAANWTTVEDKHRENPDNEDFLFGLNIQENRTSLDYLPEATRAQVFDQIWDMERGSAGSLAGLGIVKISVLMLLKRFIG